MTDRPDTKPRAARVAVGLSVAALLAPLLAMAQTPPPSASAPPASAPPSSPAMPASDSSSIWTLQDENSSISTSNLTDRYYTNGLRLGWTSGNTIVPDALQQLGQALWGDGQRRISFDLTQQMYTPDDTSAVVPPRSDRPYAGLLLGNFGLTQDTGNRRTMVGLSLGLVGPGAGGETVQDWFHHIIGQGVDNGWGSQLRDEPVFEFYSEGTWRLPIGNIGPLETDALPNLTVGLGTLRVYAESGITFRIGQGLESDFGVARLQPGLSGGDAFVPTRPFGWYVFLGADAQGVAHDLLLEGNTWTNSVGVKEEPLVGEAQGGLAILAFGTRLTYTQVVQTGEFRRQHGGLHQFGSLALSMRF